MLGRRSNGVQILDRYTVRRLAGPMVWCLGIVVGLYLVIDLFAHLDDILRFQVATAIVVRYYRAMLPLVFVQVAPFATLMAVLYTVGTLNKHQELIAMRASGVGPWRVMRPLLVIGLLLSGVALVTTERLVPRATFTVQTLREQYLERPHSPSDLPPGLRPIDSLAVYGQKHTLVYAKQFDPRAKVLTDVVILEHGPDLRIRRKISAPRAEWSDHGWRFLHCTVLWYGPDGRPKGPAVAFERKVIDTADPPEVLVRADREVSTMSSKELKAYIARLGTSNPEATRKLRVDLHTRMAVPFASVVVILLGAPLAVHRGRGGTLRGMGTAIGTALLFYGGQALCGALGKGGWLPPLAAAWGPNLLFGALGIRLLRRRLA